MLNVVKFVCLLIHVNSVCSSVMETDGLPLCIIRVLDLRVMICRVMDRHTKLNTILHHQLLLGIIMTYSVVCGSPIDIFLGLIHVAQFLSFVQVL